MEDNFNYDDNRPISGEKEKPITVLMKVRTISRVDRARKFIPRSRFLSALISKALDEKADMRVMQDFEDFWRDR